MFSARHCVRSSLRIATQLHSRHELPTFCALRRLKTSSSSSNEALESPSLDNAPKDYSRKSTSSSTTLRVSHCLEVSDLNELLKKTLNIKDMGMMPMGAMPVALPSSQALEEEAAPVKKEKTHFTVKLTELKAAEKVKLIKEVKNCIPGLNLVQAKKLVESLPQEIKANISKDEAGKLKDVLEAAGGTVVLE